MHRRLAVWACLFFTGLAGPAAAESADQVRSAYQAYVEAYRPDEAARKLGRAPDRWASVTLQTVRRQAEDAAKLRQRVAAATGLAEADRAILNHLLTADVDADHLDTARIPFTGDWGFQAEPVFAALETQIQSAADAEAWIARLSDVPRLFAEHKTNMRRGIETGWTSHKDPLGTVIEQIRVQINKAPEASDLYTPLRSLPASLSASERQSLETRGLASVRRAQDAYRDMLVFLESEYAPNARKRAGIAALPGGRAAYATLTDQHTVGAGYTPEEIHALGRSEVRRIRAEMDAILKETGYTGRFAAFQAFLRTDPQFYATSEADLMQRATQTAAKLDAILPRYFARLPKLTYTVEPVPAAIAPGYTSGRYVQGDVERSKPGAFLVNTYSLKDRPLYELPALAAHESVPGHHLQIARAQEVAGAPRYRQEYYATAFGEGWGLYAEKLAGEAGLYSTPYERFGALSMEMWRACRLVADTGLHWYGWSRAKAERCFTENTALAPLNIKTEVTRYIGWPGQAVAYKVGELKILELRARAKAKLGDKFDIKAFHELILADGSLPLDVLDAKADAWIAAGGQAPPATAAAP